MTTFTYDTEVPAAPNNPSTDQPVMKINTLSVNDILAVDHITFNLANGGQHKAITFNQDASYVPTPATGLASLFTQAFSGSDSTPVLRYYGGVAAKSSDQYVIGSAGSTLLFGGIIIKWFTQSITANSTAVTFAGGGSVGIGNFPNNAFAASVTISSAITAGINAVVGYSSLSTTGITISKFATSTAFNVTVIVIGN